MSKTWNLYKEILFNQTDVKKDSAITIQGASIDDSIMSANMVNEHFCTAGEKLATSIISLHGYRQDDISELYHEHEHNDWSFQNVDASCVMDSIKALPNKKSMITDKVPIALLKASSVKLSSILKGRLKLIHKDGDCNIENFRGLTLLPALSKIFEHILMDQLYKFFESLHLFVGNQFGFLRNLSCQSAAMQFIDVIKSNREKYVGCLFIDRKLTFH